MHDSTHGFRHGFWFQVAPAILYVALIFWLGSIEMPQGPESPPMPSDKVMHLVAFGGMQVLIFRAVRWRWPRLRFSSQLLRGAFATAGFGALLEFHQAFLPYRSADFADWVADVAGVAVASGLLALLANARMGLQSVKPPPRA